jgi:serine/threonine protein kinase
MESLRATDRLGDYELTAQVGRGPTCSVWRAQAGDGGQFALKVLEPPYLLDPAWVARFVAEAELAQSLVHQHIVRIHGVSAAPPRPYFVMDWINGGNLSRLRKVPLSDLSSAISILADACAALDYVHSRKLVHCDIKASNVLLDDQSQCYLADFGMAASPAELAESGSRGGTIHYISPEQFASATDGPSAATVVDARTDIYSLGVLMYELFTGEPPFTASNRFSLMYQRSCSDPRPPSAVRPDLPAKIDSIVLRAMARDLESRFSSAAELGWALRDSELINS